MSRLHFDILEDLSEELTIDDYFHFLSINELTYELNYRPIRRIECYMTICEKSGNPLTVAGSFNDLEAIRILHKRGLRISPYVVTNACQKGYLDIIKWVYDETDECFVKVLECACFEHQIHIMDWLHQRGIQLERLSSFDYAWDRANKCGTDVFEWLYSNERDLMMKWLKSYPFRSEVVEWIRDHYGWCGVDGEN